VLTEGKGHLIRSGLDTPYMGWLGVRALDAKVSLATAPWRALGALAEACAAFPGGLSLVWDGPSAWITDIPADQRASFLALLSRLPGLHLHFKAPELLEGLEGPVPAWLHGPSAPSGAAGHAWRQGWIGWVPQGPEGWLLPERGRVEEVEEALPAGGLWGEIILPVGALAHLDAVDMIRTVADIQARTERGLSQRMGSGAWPEVFPFHRRRTGWRLALLGGREYALAGGSLDDAATRARHLARELREHLRCPVGLGTCGCPESAAILGHQAMREGLPWRNSLPLPPAQPLFSVGLTADPRDTYALEARAQVPRAFHEVLDHPAVSLLRIPALPSEAAAEAFIRSLSPLPALRWLPPEVPPPGPFLHERPWPQASAYIPVADVSTASQPRLFDDMDWS